MKRNRRSVRPPTRRGENKDGSVHERFPRPRGVGSIPFDPFSHPRHKCQGGPNRPPRGCFISILITIRRIVPVPLTSGTLFSGLPVSCGKPRQGGPEKIRKWRCRRSVPPAGGMGKKKPLIPRFHRGLPFRSPTPLGGKMTRSIGIPVGFFRMRPPSGSGWKQRRSLTVAAPRPVANACRIGAATVRERHRFLSAPP